MANTEDIKTESDIKVSVLIPVYGVEKYIERCARSLFSQTLNDDIEFIFVDDATPDRSIDILEEIIGEYPDRKPNIRILHHERNKGLAVARVTGIKAARGEYVAHCDSDDWVEPDTYQLMYETAKANDSDIVVCSYISEYGTGNEIKQQTLLPDREQVVSSMLRFEEMHPFLWLRLIRKEFYDKHDFRADPKITFCEDLAVTIPMHLLTDKVSVVSKPLYHYNCINSGSMTQERNLRKIESCRLAMDCLEDFIIKTNHPAVMPALNYRRFLYFIPLITCLECYDPKRWLELDDPTIRIDLMIRSRLSVWLVRHKQFFLNKLVQILVRKIFNR